MSSVVVAVRVRPFNSREMKYDSKLIIGMTGEASKYEKGDENSSGHMVGGKPVATTVTTIKQVKQGKVQENEPPRKFTFDYCFWTFDNQKGQEAASPGYADQGAVYNSLGVNILNNSLEGYNSTLFAYGQTGSGKTYTMMGVPSDPGIIPRLCIDLFNRVQAGAEDSSKTFKIECTYLEIYNEQVRDLLNPGAVDKVLKVRQHPKLGTFVENLTKLTVKSSDEVTKLLDEGSSIRSVAATNMNAHSSRSHAIFTLLVRCAAASTGEGGGNGTKETFSSLNLVDLAGSERAASTGAAGQTLAEGANINKSLTTLGMCLSRLADQGDGKKGGLHVPFRDSQLTWLLADSLGGNSKTCMLAALSPADINADETMTTLRFAETTKKIKQQAVVNEDPQQRLIRELKAEIEVAKAELKALGGESGGGDAAGNLPAAMPGNKSKAELLQDLVDSTELFQELTETEEEKENKEKMIRKMREKQFAKLKDNNRIPINTSIPRLHALNEDMHRFPDISLLYYLHEGPTWIGSKKDAFTTPEGEKTKCSVVLKVKKTERQPVALVHCLIHCDALKRVVTIQPFVAPVAEGEDPIPPPETFVNGELLKADGPPKVLHHLDRIIIGPLVFRHAQPAVWQHHEPPPEKGDPEKNDDGANAPGGVNALMQMVEFSREPQDDTHAMMLGEYDELDSQVKKFNDNVKSSGEASALKVQPHIRETKSQLSEVESRLVMDYPLDESAAAGTTLEQALTFDIHFALKERDRVKHMKRQQAASDDTIAALLTELDHAKEQEKDLDAKYEAQRSKQQDQQSKLNRARAISIMNPGGTAHQDTMDLDDLLNTPPKDKDLLADLGDVLGDDDDDDDDDLPPPPGAGGKHQDPMSLDSAEADAEEANNRAAAERDLLGTPTTAGGGEGDASGTAGGGAGAAGAKASAEEASALPAGELPQEDAAPITKPLLLPAEYDEPAPQKIGRSNAGSSSSLSLKAMLARELMAYEDEVSRSQQWSPDGPSIQEDRPEWTEWSGKNSVTVGKLTSPEQAERISKQGSGVFKLRIKQTMFHKGGFHPVHAVLRGRFFYYFDEDKPTCGNLGSAHLYGAQIYQSTPPTEGKTHILKIVPTVPRKPSKSSKGITAENNLVLAFESEELKIEWYRALLKATLPTMSESLAKFFGKDDAPPIVTGNDNDSNKGQNKRIETSLKDGAEIKLTDEDKEKIEEQKRDDAAKAKEAPTAVIVEEAPCQIKASEDAVDQLHNHAMAQQEDTTASAATATFADDDKPTAGSGGGSATDPDAMTPEQQADFDQYKIPVRQVHNPRYLKYYFHASKAGDKNTKANNKHRMWLVDHFAKTVELVDLKQKKATVYKAKQILVVEKHLTDSCRLHVSFFHHGYHPHSEHFLTSTDRNRFYETLQAIRPAIRVYCPSLVIQKGAPSPPAAVDSITPIDARGAESMIVSCGQEKKKMKLEGACHLRVSSQVHESLSVWTGTLNLCGFPLQSREVLESWIPIGRYDLYAITVQEASYRTTQNQFFDFVMQSFGKDFSTVAQMDLYDTLLIVVCRRRHLLKISSIEGSTCPSSIESLSGERGGVGISLRYLETSFCFVAVHLPANASRQDLRRFMLNEILCNLQLGDKNVDLVSQFDYLFLLGDFSFNMSKAATLDKLEEAAALQGEMLAQKKAEADAEAGEEDDEEANAARELKKRKKTVNPFEEYVLKHDSFFQEREGRSTTGVKKPASASGNKLLAGFSEPAIEFPPTYPVEVGTENYNIGKNPTPSYPNRILVRTAPPTEGSTSSSGGGGNNLQLIGYKAIRRVLLTEQIPVAASFLVKCLRPIAACFLPPPPAVAQHRTPLVLTVLNVKLAKSLNCKKPALYITAPSLGCSPKMLEADTCAYPQDGGYAWTGKNASSGKNTLVFPLNHMVEDYHSSTIGGCQTKLLVSILDLGEKDPAKQQKGTAIVPLAGRLTPGKSPQVEGGMEGKLQSIGVAFTKTGRVLTKCTLMLSWEPAKEEEAAELLSGDANEEDDDDATNDV